MYYFWSVRVGDTSSEREGDRVTPEEENAALLPPVWKPVRRYQPGPSVTMYQCVCVCVYQLPEQSLTGVFVCVGTCL